MNLITAIKTAKRDVAELSDLPLNSIIGAEFESESNQWIVNLELVERKGIPDTMDLIGLYEFRIDDNGETAAFERIGMRKRGDSQVQMSEGY